MARARISIPFGLLALVAMSVNLTAVNAFAFQQNVPGSAAAPALPVVPGIEITPQSSQRGAGLELTVPDQGNAPGGGKGIAVPGLGMLPKLDFGLELLYGAPDHGSPNSDPTDTLPDALTVHGEVKKTF